jgi:ATP-dependent helicase/DNAse subunit B
MVQELKLKAAQEGALTGNMVSMNRLPRYLYDHLKGASPVIDLSTREMMVQGIMGRMELRSLSRSQEARAGMVRAVSKAVGELLAHEVSFSGLRKIAASRRSVEFAEVYAEYRKELREHRLLDRDMLPASVRELLKGNVLFKKLGIYLPGQLSLSMERMIGSLIGSSEEVVVSEHPLRGYPHFLSGGVEPKRPDPDPSIPLPGEVALSRLSSKREFLSISGMDRTDTVRKIFQEIKRRSLEEGIDPSEFSLVLPVRQDYDDIVREISREYGIPVDQGEDLRLERVSIVSAILGLIRSFQNGLRRPDVVEALSSPFLELRDDEGKSITGQDLEVVTRAALMGPERRDPQRGWREVLLNLSTADGTDKHTAQVASRTVEPLSRLLTKGETMVRSRALVNEHKFALIDILRRLFVHERLASVVVDGERMEDSPPGEGPFQINVPGIHGFYSALRSIERRARVLGKGRIAFKDLMSSLELEMSKMSVRSAPRVPGVVIMGLTESVGLSHGIVFFAGLAEGEMPPSESGFRLLSEKERERLDLPPDDMRRRFLEQLAIAVGSTDDPLLCYHRSSSDRPLSVSSFIEDLALVDVQGGGDLRSMVDVHRRIGEMSDPLYQLYHGRGGEEALELFSVPYLLGIAGKEGERIRRGLLAMRSRRRRDCDGAFGRITEEDLISYLADRYGPEHVWSVTQFETYRKCPYSYFVRYVLGIQELEDLEPGIPPEKKGLIFHEVADRFYREFPPSFGPRVDRSNLDRAIPLIRDITKQTLDSYPNSGPYWDALMDQFIGGPGEKGLLDNFLEVEADYSGPFIVDRTELKFGMGNGAPPPVHIYLPGDGSGTDRFLLRGSVDRLDILSAPRGDLSFIWDYKTGSRVDDGSVQVPLYLSAMRKLYPERYPGGGGYYYVRKRGAVEREPTLGAEVWNGSSSDGTDIQSVISGIDEKIHDTVGNCLGMIDGIRAGEFGADLDCRDRWCPFVKVCRRGDAR